MSSTTPISITKNPINAEGISECFHKVSTSLYLSLAPVYALNPVAGIKAQHLDPLLMTYFQPAGGVVLAHFNLKVTGNEEPSQNSTKEDEAQPVLAKVMYDSPFAFLWIQVDFLVWKPQPQDVVEGWINMSSPSHIGLLIHDTFNATIKRESIPNDWVFIPNQADEEGEEEEDLALANSVDNAVATLEKDEQAKQLSTSFRDHKSLGHWQDGLGKKIEGKIKFTVKSFLVTGRFVSIQGSLVAGTVPEDLTKQSEPKQHKRFDTEEGPTEVPDSTSAMATAPKYASSSSSEEETSDEDSD